MAQPPGRESSHSPFLARRGPKTNTEALEKIKRGLGYDERVAAFRAVTKLNEFVPKLPQSKQLKELMQMAETGCKRLIELQNQVLE